MTTPYLLEARGIVVKFCSVAVLKSVNFGVAAGEYVSLVGPNGAGKTTLLRALLGAQELVAGEIFLSGINLKNYSRRQIAAHLAYVPQYLEVPFSFTVMDFVAMGRFAFQRGLARFSNADKQAVSSALQQLQIDHLSNRTLGALSGGERQRASIAAALAQNPKVLLLDELTRSLDPVSEQTISALLRELSVRGKLAVVSASHDLNRAAYDSQRVAAIREGEMVCDEPAAEFLREEILAKIYGRALPLVRDGATGRVFTVPEVQ